MSVLNFTVYCPQTSLLWRIGSSTPPYATFCCFFFLQNSVLTKIDDGKHLVAKCVVRRKDNLDAMDSDLVVGQVVTLLAPF